MAVYAVGDIQGCADPLFALLDKIGFEPQRDRLWFVGDLVNRGPRSLDVLRFVRDLGSRAVTVLGNHDLHLLAIWFGQAKLKPHDSVQQVLEAPDAAELMDWLRCQPLLHHEANLDYVMVHAGILPAWDVTTAKARAREVESALQAPDPSEFFRQLYGDEPNEWDESLTGMDRLRLITNVFTRMRYCDADGRLLLDYKGAPETAPAGHFPWFEVPSQRRSSADPTIVCGHWSTLGYREAPGVLALDTGCLWGGRLTATRIDAKPHRSIHLPCEACLTPRR